VKIFLVRYIDRRRKYHSKLTPCPEQTSPLWPVTHLTGMTRWTETHWLNTHSESMPQRVPSCTIPTLTSADDDDDDDSGWTGAPFTLLHQHVINQLTTTTATIIIDASLISLRTAEKPRSCFRGCPWLSKGETRSHSYALFRPSSPPLQSFTPCLVFFPRELTTEG